MAMLSKEGGIVEDTFVSMMREIMALPKDRAKAKTREISKMCVCGSCPTYTGCARNAGEAVFCSHGTSFHCISEAKGCLCPGCPAAKQIGLKYQAFCLAGSEKTQRFDMMIR